MDDCQLLEMVGVSMIFPATLGMGKLKKDCHATGNRPPFLDTSNTQAGFCMV